MSSKSHCFPTIDEKGNHSGIPFGQDFHQGGWNGCPDTKGVCAIIKHSAVGCPRLVWCVYNLFKYGCDKKILLYITFSP